MKINLILSIIESEIIEKVSNMAENKLPSGVGKKIVQALKKQQATIEIQAIPDPVQEHTAFASETIAPVNVQENEIITDNISLDEEFPEFAVEDNSEENFDMFEEVSAQEQQEEFSSEFDDSFGMSFDEDIDVAAFDENEDYSSQSIKGATVPQSHQKSYAVPANVAVLKRLIMQLPQGVTKQTGAQIIRQTMEALGISMGSVLKEAQQGQDSLTASAKACLSTIAEYKNNIRSLEKQVQDYKKQAIALNDLINLFLMTDKR